MSPEFLLTAFVVCIAPGIGVVYTLSMTLGGGFRAGIWASIGCTIATVLHLIVALAGLAAVLHTSAVLFQTVKYAGVAYLLWMAWAVLKAKGGMDIAPAAPAPIGRIVWRGVLLNILNPKLPLFFVAFLPQFLPTQGATLGLMIELGLGFSAMTFVTFLLYAVLAATGRRALLGSPSVMAWLRRAFAASFAGLGAKLAMERAA
ncbi:LysE family translocator [Gemmobacter fulvus]|uniref:LysE family translocator n=1 Tax=Gemmobacter fulvus TaxID=2840474 RepID=A0A975P5P4_9RHOB|nr:LysE family translocator [Gemmobacter fulvus]MBT9245658.1 LysE family translocator [Gemmobacter fulvus]QWK89488.1 LysE family translocator [Gemmobacter fulvus]